MTDAQAEDFMRRLTMLAEILGEPLSPARLAGYRMALDDLDPEDLAGALNYHAKHAEYFPKPAVIRHRAEVLADIRHTDAIRAMQAYEGPRAELPASVVAPTPASGLTPEERAAQDARIEAGWQALFAKVREIAATKAMPDAPPSPTIIQIEAWKRGQA